MRSIRVLYTWQQCYIRCPQFLLLFSVFCSGFFCTQGTKLQERAWPRGPFHAPANSFCKPHTLSRMSFVTTVWHRQVTAAPPASPHQPWRRSPPALVGTPAPCCSWRPLLLLGRRLRRLRLRRRLAALLQRVHKAARAKGIHHQASRHHPSKHVSPLAPGCRRLQQRAGGGVAGWEHCLLGSVAAGLPPQTAASQPH